jgi:chitinase
MANVTFYRDGIKIGTDSSSPYSVNWSTSGRSFGAHSLTAVAKDVAGNTATSAPITVTLTR